MHPLFWFAVILALSVVYGWRIRAVVGHVKSPLAHWWVAVSLVASLVLGTLLATRLNISVPRDSGVAIHAAALFVCAWLGLRYWVAWRPWDIPAAALSLALVGAYFLQPQRYNNLILAVLALGMSVGGYYVTKKWLRVFYTLMAGFDAYLIWWSTLGDELARGQTGLFPSSLIIGKFNLPLLEIGTLDVVLGAMAVVGIQHHRGFRRSLGFVVGCLASTCIIALLPELLLKHGHRFARPSPLIAPLVNMPFLVVLAPLVWWFLRSHGRVKSAKS